VLAGVGTEAGAADGAGAKGVEVEAEAGGAEEEGPSNPRARAL